MTFRSNINALDLAEPYDVCIVGSGFVGTIVGRDLVRRGIRTVMLESGTSLHRWIMDGRLKALAAYEVTGDADYPTVRTKARAVGGNSNFWTGRCERFHPSDFLQHAYTPPGNPWPINYDELEPYYERAEQTLRVRGGQRSHFAPPRKQALPLPAKSDISALKAILHRAGLIVDDSPTATPKRWPRFFRMSRELLPEFLSSPVGVLVCDVTVTKLLTDGTRRIVGAEARALDGSTKIVRAKNYIVACGGIETPRLLLLSSSEVFHNGIGNDYDRVGRGFNEHPGVNFFASIRQCRETLYPRHKIGRSHQLYNMLRADGLGGILPVFIQSWIFPNHLVHHRLRDVPGALSALLRRIVRPSLYIGIVIEMISNDDNRVTLAKHAADRYGNPLAHLHLNFSEPDRTLLDRSRKLIRDIYTRLGATDVHEAPLTWSRHHIGSCRMGENPKTSVVDPTLRVHGCPNLYLCGSETFVTGTAMPPVMTIVALAHRLSEQIAMRLTDS